MSSGLVVYLYLYAAPGLNDRRFGRRTIIVTHVDRGRQDDSDSSWRSAGGGTSQKGSFLATSHRPRVSETMASLNSNARMFGTLSTASTTIVPCLSRQCEG